MNSDYIPGNSVTMNEKEKGRKDEKRKPLLIGHKDERFENYG